MVCISSCIPRPVSTDATDLAKVQKPAPRTQWVNYGTRTLGSSKAIHQRTCIVGGPLCRVFLGRGPERGGRSCCFCHVRAISGLSFGSTMWHVRRISATQLRTYTDLSMYA
jgi:hypothetical protein